MAVSEHSSSENTDTVILGCGIIGLCTAYFLTEDGKTNPKNVHVIDSSPKLFHCASGLAAGFLSADWFAPSVSSLGTLSFKLHAELAKAHGGRETWGYSSSTGISFSQDSESAIAGSGEDWLENGTSRAQASQNRPREEQITRPAWLRGTQEGVMEVISRDGTTAQIDPLRFCQWLLKEVKERGVNVHQPVRATSIIQDQDGVLSGIRIQAGEDVESQTELSCSRLVIASGAWSPRVFSTLFPASKSRIPISPLAGHSLLVRNPNFNPQEGLDKEVCHAVFATDTLGFSPEWFARLGGELYLGGLNSTTVPLPDIATDVKASEKAIEQLRECAKLMTVAVPGKELEVLREGLCFRPVTSSGRPIVSRIPDEKLGGGVKTKEAAKGGVFIAAGHGAWGISHAPGTGLVLSELMLGRPTSAKVEALQFPL